MIQAMEKRTAIRVLRSSTLPASNIYRPAKGLRYDGLYVIDDVELLDPGTSMYRFKLVRLEGQRPIRYQGKEIRPSVSELHELAKVHHMFAKEE